MIGVIYKYTSTSGKIYIGQTINPKEQYRKHISESYNAKYTPFKSNKKVWYRTI